MKIGLKGIKLSRKELEYFVELDEKRIESHTWAYTIYGGILYTLDEKRIERLFNHNALTADIQHTSMKRGLKGI